MNQLHLKTKIIYDHDSGDFFWKSSGKIAGGFRSDGYRVMRIDGVLYYGHRLAWMYVNGDFPESVIDHIDRDPSNNKISNLRAATRSQNSRNISISKASKSGVTGVTWCENHKYWMAKSGKNKEGGKSEKKFCSPDFFEAVCVRKSWDINGLWIKPIRAKSLTVMGETKTISEWAKDDRVIVAEPCIRQRLKKGLSHFDCLFMARKTHKLSSTLLA